MFKHNIPHSDYQTIKQGIAYTSVLFKKRKIYRRQRLHILKNAASLMEPVNNNKQNQQRAGVVMRKHLKHFRKQNRKYTKWKREP